MRGVTAGIPTAVDKVEHIESQKQRRGRADLHGEEVYDELDPREQNCASRPALAEVLVKLSAEVRAQLRLEHDISRTLIDLRVVREFQRTVFEVISQESPEAARRIVGRLKEHQALRRSAELPTLDGRGGLDGGFDVA